MGANVWLGAGALTYPLGAKEVTLFAFPYGDTGTDREAVDAALRLGGYEAACVYGGGPVEFPPAHRFFLERLAIGSDTNLAAELG
jgi:hypothetical protein